MCKARSSVIRRTGLAALLVLSVVGGLVLVPPPSPAEAFDPGSYAVPTAAIGTGTAATGVSICVTTVVCAGVAAVAIGAVGISVGTYTTLSWLDPGDDPPGPESSIGVQSTGIVDCPASVSSAGNKCLRIAAAALPVLNPAYADGFSQANPSGFQITSRLGQVNVPYFTVSGSAGYYGDSSTGSFPDGQSGNLWHYYVLNPATPTYGIVPGDAARFTAYMNSAAGVIGGATVYGSARLSPAVDTSGLRRQLQTMNVCTNGTVTEFRATSSLPFWDRDAADVPMPFSPCPTGWRSTLIYTDKVTIGGANYSPAIGTRRIWTWTAPVVDPQLQPTVDRCLSNGAECDLETVPAVGTQPERCEWGGDVVPDSWCTNTTPITGGTPPQTSTTTTTTAVVTTLPVTATDPTPPGTPDDPPGGGTFQTCLDERLEGFGGDFSLTSPGTWIRTVIAYIVAPIFCALYWFFVPAGGWAAALLPFRDIWDTSPVLEPLRNLFDLGAGTSCSPWQLDSSFFGPGGVTLDVGLCGNTVISSIWYVFLGLAAVGMVYDLFGSVSDFRAKRKDGPE